MKLMIDIPEILFEKIQNRKADKRTLETVIMRGISQEPILDKIRAEIEQLTSRYSISKERGGMGQVEWSDRLIKESDVLQILDKYRGEVDCRECKAEYECYYCKKYAESEET